ncbi:hypothetical protein CIK05_07455 [Bdellovibrio sp. qaytius]|nr:hypothetical protein CIK05_07455 [Bdellovibrio sp. qaytius]
MNSCIVPIFFVGFQFRTLKSPAEINLHKHITDLSQGNFKQYTSNNCTYYFNKKSAHYYTVCQNADVCFIGTDVRSSDSDNLKDIEKVKLIDAEVNDRILHIEKALASLKPSITNHSYTVYKSFELESF